MGKAALVTGASAGIGRELARCFAADGHDLLLVARRRDRLEELSAELGRAYGVAIDVLAEDLSDPGAPARIAAAAATREVEFLVNNAGYGTRGAFAELDASRELSMIQVNVVALVALTRSVLPAMVARRSGRILNIGSTAGFQPGPYMAVYYASKAFVNSFTEAISFELRETGVSVTLCCPGPTESEFAQIAGTDRSRLFRRRAMGARVVAEGAYRAMLRAKPIYIPGPNNRWGVQSLRVAPRALVRRVVAGLNRDSPLPPSRARGE
jgi:uncharacterized protein